MNDMSYYNYFMNKVKDIADKPLLWEQDDDEMYHDIKQEWEKQGNIFTIDGKLVADVINDVPASRDVPGYVEWSDNIAFQGEFEVKDKDGELIYYELINEFI